MQMAASKKLYVQVLSAILLGILLGHFYPQLAVELKPLGDIFVRLIKLMVAPIIFVTVTVGLARSRHGASTGLGRLGMKAIVYFEVVTTLAMIIGLGVGFLFQPGSGMHVDIAQMDTSALASYKAAKPFSTLDFLISIVPTSFVDPFLKGEMLQVLFIATLSGFALSLSGSPGAKVVEALEWVTVPLFKMVALIMRFAPLGALGAMAFTIGKFGVGTLVSYGYLMASFYVTCAAFIILVLGTITNLSGFSLLLVLRYLKEEALIVVACASNEAVLPALVQKFERLGIKESVVGLVLPLSYALNLDGACIYYTLALTFMSQAMGIHLTWPEQLTYLAVLLLTSKGSATVTGGGFITLAATLATVAGKVPVEAMILLIGIDRFMSEARAFTNFCGNVVATVAIAKMGGAIDMEHANKLLASPNVSDTQTDLRAA